MLLIPLSYGMFPNITHETKHCNLQRHSSLTPIYMYIHKMNIDIHHETEHCNLQGHSSLTPICTFIKWTFMTSTVRLFIAIYKDTVPWPLYRPTYTFIKWTLMYWEWETHTHNLRFPILLNGDLKTLPPVIVLLVSQ